MELRLPFDARGQRGEICVRYLVNGDPARWGFGILGLEGDVSRAADFPVFEASVAYEGEGYAAIFGWIQVVRYWRGDADKPASALVDVAPQFRGTGFPFLTWGVRPTAFDAPLDTPEGHTRWEAFTFLTQTPDGLMTRTVEPIVGVSWGYIIHPESPPTLVPPDVAGQAEWLYVKDQLERGYAEWTFGTALPPPVQ